MTHHLISVAPGSFRRDERPPIAMDPAPASGAAEPYPLLRPTVRPRPTISPAVWADAISGLGYPHHHRYVRRYWTAVLGQGAVANLLRLATAAQRGRSLPRPVHLPALVRAGLVLHADGRIAVRTTIPPLSPNHVRRLHPALRREHRAFRWQYPHRL